MPGLLQSYGINPGAALNRKYNNLENETAAKQTAANAEIMKGRADIMRAENERNRQNSPSQSPSGGRPMGGGDGGGGVPSRGGGGGGGGRPSSAAPSKPADTSKTEIFPIEGPKQTSPSDMFEDQKPASEQAVKGYDEPIGPPPPPDEQTPASDQAVKGYDEPIGPPPPSATDTSESAPENVPPDAAAGENTNDSGGVAPPQEEIGNRKGLTRVPGKGKNTAYKTNLAPGEAVLNKKAANTFGRGMISKLNSKGAMKMGLVDPRSMKDMKVNRKGSTRVPGKGDGTKDTVPALLAPGEAVLNKAAADSVGRKFIAKANKKGAEKMGLR